MTKSDKELIEEVFEFYLDFLEAQIVEWRRIGADEDFIEPNQKRLEEVAYQYSNIKKELEK